MITTLIIMKRKAPPPQYTPRDERKAVQQAKYTTKCKLQELLDVKEMTRHALSLATGLTSASIRGLCENTTKRYDSDTLGVLCSFFDCEVGDLIIRVERGED
ncbi:helix-turn-helix domain-containing protein [Nostoc sp.]|jgi:putative transcriptional regulator